jgi:hypothetical protein
MLAVFRYDALRTELAGMGEDRRAVALQVLAVLDARRSVGEELGQPVLALPEGARPPVRGLQFEQIDADDGNQYRRGLLTTRTGNAPSPPPAPAFPSGSPATSMAGFFLLADDGGLSRGRGDMPTWCEDSLRGATLGLLIFLGVALLLGGVVYWL